MTTAIPQGSRPPFGIVKRHALLSRLQMLAIHERSNQTWHYTPDRLGACARIRSTVSSNLVPRAVVREARKCDVFATSNACLGYHMLGGVDGGHDSPCGSKHSGTAPR